jgi:hypothetical protein
LRDFQVKYRNDYFATAILKMQIIGVLVDCWCVTLSLFFINYTSICFEL